MLDFSSKASKHIWQKLVQYIKGLRSFDTQWMRNNWVSPRRVTKLLFFAHEWHRCDIGSSSCVGWAKILNLSQAKLIRISFLLQFYSNSFNKSVQMWNKNLSLFILGLLFKPYLGLIMINHTAKICIIFPSMG